MRRLVRDGSEVCGDLTRHRVRVAHDRDLELVAEHRDLPDHEAIEDDLALIVEHFDLVEVTVRGVPVGEAREIDAVVAELVELDLGLLTVFGDARHLVVGDEPPVGFAPEAPVTGLLELRGADVLDAAGHRDLVGTIVVGRLDLEGGHERRAICPDLRGEAARIVGRVARVVGRAAGRVVDVGVVVAAAARHAQKGEGQEELDARHGPPLLPRGVAGSLDTFGTTTAPQDLGKSDLACSPCGFHGII